MFASITQWSNVAVVLGKDDEDDDSIIMSPTIVTPSKKYRASREEFRQDRNGDCSKTGAKFASFECLRK